MQAQILSQDSPSITFGHFLILAAAAVILSSLRALPSLFTLLMKDPLVSNNPIWRDLIYYIVATLTLLEKKITLKLSQTKKNEIMIQQNWERVSINVCS